MVQEIVNLSYQTVTCSKLTILSLTLLMDYFILDRCFHFPGKLISHKMYY